MNQKLLSKSLLTFTVALVAFEISNPSLARRTLTRGPADDESSMNDFSPGQTPSQSQTQSQTQFQSQYPNLIPMPSPTPTPVGSEFSSGSPAYLKPFSQAWIHKQIQDTMKLQMTKDGAFAKIEAVSQKGESFNISFNTGLGNGGAAGSFGNGAIIVNPGTTNNTPQPYVGLTISYTKSNCTQTILIDPTLMYIFKLYLYTLMDENGAPLKTLDPAHQTVMLFYTTVISKATGCQASSR